MIEDNVDETNIKTDARDDAIEEIIKNAEVKREQEQEETIVNDEVELVDAEETELVDAEQEVQDKELNEDSDTSIKGQYDEPEREEIVVEQKVQPDEDSLSLEDRANQLSDALDNLSIGTDEEKLKAVETLQTLLSPKDDNAYSNEDIVAETAKKVSMQLNYDKAQESFYSEYDDIVKDKSLHNEFNQEFNSILDNANSYQQAFTEAGDAVREKIEFRAWQKNKANPSEMESRLDAKKQLASRSVKASSTVAQLYPKEKAPTQQELINEVRKSRGQSV